MIKVGDKVRINPDTLASEPTLAKWASAEMVGEVETVTAKGRCNIGVNFGDADSGVFALFTETNLIVDNQN